MLTTDTRPRLTDLFPVAETGCSAHDELTLTAMVRDGYVRVQRHPTLPLRIFNYSEKAAYEGVWNAVTLACRGLIVDDEDYVVARPFTKFFNYGQTGAAEIPLDAKVQVVDKMDGSLGIVYPVPGGYAIATRGSFASEQALHATEVLQTRYPRWWQTPGFTALFEIVYPSNRIVVDYGSVDDLVALGVVDIATGEVHQPGALRLMGWRGPVAEVFDAETLAEALALEPRPNAEGVVVRDLESGAMLKIKQEDYVKLHRIVTGLTARTVWEYMLAGAPLAELIEPLPDEFHPWVAEIAAGIDTAVRDEAWRLEEEYTKVRDGMPSNWQQGDRASRAVFARVAGIHPDKWALFALLDGRDIRPELLKRAKPEPYITPAGRTYGEDTA